MSELRVKGGALRLTNLSSMTAHDLQLTVCQAMLTCCFSHVTQVETTLLRSTPSHWAYAAALGALCLNLGHARCGGSACSVQDSNRRVTAAWCECWYALGCPVDTLACRPLGTQEVAPACGALGGVPRAHHHLDAHLA